MKNTLFILVKKLLKYILLSTICIMVEGILESLEVFGFFDKNIKFLSVDIFLLILGMIVILCSVMILGYRNISSFHVFVKKYFQSLIILFFLGEILVLYKCFCYYQMLVCIFEFSVLYLVIDFELSKLYVYNSHESKPSCSNYVEKPVVGRDNLTKNQDIALNQLIELIDGRKSTDGFNVALIGAWGGGKTSITDTLIYEFVNRKNENKYFMLKISVLSLNETKNIVFYVKNYFEELFRKYEIGLGRRNIAFLTTLAKCFGTSMPWDDVLGGNNDNFFLDLENEKELFTRQVQKLLKVSGRKNIIFFIDDTDRSEDENEIIKLLSEFASIDGIISIVSLDKKKDIIIRPCLMNEEITPVYNPIDKYIHVRIRITDDKRIENDKRISEQMMITYRSLSPKENCYITCDGQNDRNSLFMSVRDCQTTEIINTHNLSNSSYNILTELFFENLRMQQKPFGVYFEELMSEYIYNSKELIPYIQKMLTTPLESWNPELYMVNAQWTNSLAMEGFDWLMRLQSNSSTIFWTLCQVIEAIDLVCQCPKEIHNEIKSVEDIYDYWMIQKFPMDDRNWENRKEHPVIYSGFDQIKLIVFQNGEWERLNENIEKNEYILVRNTILKKVKDVANLFLISLLLMDFMEYLRIIMNNYRTFKMQLREAELLKLNYLDYIIKEWQPRQQIRDNYEKMKEDNPIIKELNIPMPSLPVFINNLLFENYILKFGNRFRDSELKSGRLYVYHGKNQNIIVISQKELPVTQSVFLDVSGRVIPNVDPDDLIEIEKKNDYIWTV